MDATLINKIRGVIYGQNSCQKSQTEPFINIRQEYIYSDCLGCDYLGFP